MKRAGTRNVWFFLLDLSINTYHTSAVAKCIPYQSSFIMLKFQQNRTKQGLIKILFVTSLTKEDEPTFRSKKSMRDEN